jgi:hypothetical protein
MLTAKIGKEQVSVEVLLINVESTKDRLEPTVK